MTLTSGHLGHIYTLTGRGGRQGCQLHEAPTCRIVVEMCQRGWLAEKRCVTGSCTCRRGRVCLACRRVGKCGERRWMGACLARQRVCKCAGREWEGVGFARQRASERGARVFFCCCWHVFVRASSACGGGCMGGTSAPGVCEVRGHCRARRGRCREQMWGRYASGGRHCIGFSTTINKTAPVNATATPAKVYIVLEAEGRKQCHVERRKKCQGETRKQCQAERPKQCHALCSIWLTSSSTRFLGGRVSPLDGHDMYRRMHRCRSNTIGCGNSYRICATHG